MIIRPSPAKINLHLHITDRRDDGYHELQSLVAFTDFGDEVSIQHSSQTSINFTGEFSAEIPQDNNSVTKAHRALELFCGYDLPCTITVQKNIPIGTGLGGGSGNAAATLHALVDFFNLDITHDDLMVMAASIGSDVPACLYDTPIMMTGRGEHCSPAPSFPLLPAVIIWPHISHPTAMIYQSYATITKGQFSVPVAFPDYFDSAENLCSFLNQSTHNDLEQAALHHSPALIELLQNLRSQNHCLLTRMTGSGSACFAIFDTIDHADDALQVIQKKFPNYWGISTYILGG